MEVITNIKKSYSHIPYTWKHYRAFMQTQKKLLGHYKYWFHDVDKLFMYIVLPFLGTKRISQIHQRIQPHHPIYTIGKNKIKQYKTPKQINWEEAIIDWECARLTKSDKPLDAYDTLKKFFHMYTDFVKPHLIRLKLWRD